MAVCREFYSRYNLANAYSRTDVAAVGGAITTTASSTSFQGQVIQALTAQILPQVTAAVSASVAAGLIPAAAAPAIIQQAVTAAVKANAPAAIQAAAVNANIGNLKPYQPKEFKPERVANYEIGYRALLSKRLLVDAYYYYSVYTNFIGNVILIQPTRSIAPGVLPVASGVLSGDTRNVYSVPVNSSERITASGWAVGLNYALPKGYGASANIAHNQLNDFTPTAELQTAGYNTPANRYNLGLTKRPLGASNWGFALAFRYQDAFTWEGFAVPSEAGVPLYANSVVPAIRNLDAQVNYKAQPLKSIVKLGATNLFGNPYIQAYGNPAVGSTYYISLTFDQLLN